MSGKFLLTNVLFVSGLISAPAFAQLVPANHFECTGSTVSVNYSTSSLAGVPVITVDLNGTVITRSGRDIQIQRTVLGSLVTIVRAQVADQFTDTLSLVVPDVNVDIEAANSVDFPTEGAYTRTHTTIAGPSRVPGVVQQSMPQLLVCRATAVRF